MRAMFICPTLLAHIDYFLLSPLLLKFPAPQQRLQPILGFGAGTTDATSVTLLNVKATNETRYWEMMNLLFDVSPKAIEMGGAGLNIIRSPLGASDFSLA